MITTETSRPSARAQRRAARRTKIQYLITADENALAELQATLATLPLCASGRVFIEVPDASAIASIEVPSRMTVTWLPRATRTGTPGSGRACAPGQAVARAANAWASEMLCREENDSAEMADESAASVKKDCVETHVTLLGGFLGTADIVDHLTDALGVDPASIYAPERFGLLPTR